MVRLEPYCLGEITGPHRERVFILSEREGERKFPIVLSMENREMYLRDFESVLHGVETPTEMAEYFSQATGIHIRRIFIKADTPKGSRCEVCAVDEWGGSFLFRVPLHLGVRYAVTNHLHIYIEEELLNIFSKGIRLRTSDEEDTSQKYLGNSPSQKGSKVENISTLEFVMKVKRSPENLPSQRVKMLLEGSSRQELEKAFEISLSQEQYEWSRVISDEISRRG